ncbi:uncharacterized protein N7482_004373 [Penicillium canariense]|uniref:Zn(2)-C6 fungal-type domain-containing protein n=1 Tax=Penicillium canariense TaxID=189055 RepID=A0A9W9I693_9EURO|nr:uncharacterized protein N7482_004373 [Penicillium canariense]KAJ5168779.1 hypothetical protein N7482_004373 [Penicillium canariense]
MPGVPSGKACEACRKQKKKCDEKQPACGRCLRLKIPCVGSGQQRFKFQEDKRFTKQIRRDHKDAVMPTISKSNASSSDGTPSPPGGGHVLFIHAKPSNGITLLAAAFTQAIKRSTDIRYNLWWSFGLFLEDVPRRLGTNEALDRAVDAVTSAHADFCTRRQGSVQSLTKYSAALRTLRVYLDDRVHAQETDTLAAVMILLICQTMLGQGNQCWSGHAEGATQILKARKEFGPRNEFEAKIYLSLRGSVLFEGLFNERIQLTQEEWDSLIVNKYDGGNPEGRMLLNLSRAPSILRRARLFARTASDPSGVQDELWAVYQACMINLDQLKESSIKKDLSVATAMPRPDRAWVERLLLIHYDRIYGIGLVITLFFNCMLQALGLHNDAVQSDACYFTEEILMLAETSELLRPVGSGYLIICLTTAWAATKDPEQRARAMMWLHDYHSDFNFRQLDYLQKELEWTAGHLNLADSFQMHRDLEYPRGSLI